MIKNSSSLFAVVAIAFSFVLANSNACDAQTPVAMYPTPVYAHAHRGFHRHHHHYYAPAVVPATYTTYYAPQVPVVPQVVAPVPTVSAYYVPTAPVVAPYYSTVVTVRRPRRVVAVAPAVVYPAYWWYW